MRNEILIFEHAIDLIKKHVEAHGNWTVDREAYNNAVRQAAYEAGKRRMVPIFIFAGGIGSLIMVVTMLPVIYWKVSTK